MEPIFLCGIGIVALVFCYAAYAAKTPVYPVETCRQATLSEFF